MVVRRHSTVKPHNNDVNNNDAVPVSHDALISLLIPYQCVVMSKYTLPATYACDAYMYYS